jgi:hypothetical protein
MINLNSPPRRGRHIQLHKACRSSCLASSMWTDQAIRNYRGWIGWCLEMQNQAWATQERASRGVLKHQIIQVVIIRQRQDVDCGFTSGD